LREAFADAGMLSQFSEFKAFPLEHDDDWWKHRIAVLCRAGVGVTLCKPKTMGENLTGNRAARLETARPED
jgi:hypothetical protein